MKVIVALILLALYTVCANYACNGNNGIVDEAHREWASSSWNSVDWQRQSQWVQATIGGSLMAAQLVPPAAVGSGSSGVVMVAGAPHLRSAYLSMKLLKTHWPSAEAELFHVGVSTLPVDAKAEFEALGVRVRDLRSELPDELLEETVSADNAVRVGWKMHALQRSSFDNILLLDANVLPLRNPSELFQLPSYISAGAIFFPTNYEVASGNPVWTVMGVQCQSGLEQDSSVVLINKHRMAAAISIALHMGKGAYQTLFRGDVDALRMGALSAGLDYHMSSYQPSIGGNEWLIDGDRTFCAHARVHASPLDGAPMFVQLMNHQVLADGSRADKFTCLDRSLSASPLSQLLPSFESSLLQMQSVLPGPIGRVRPMACTTRSLTDLLNQVRANQAEELVLLDGINLNAAVNKQSNQLLLMNVCGFFTCGPAVNDMQVQLYQLNTTRSAYIEVRMNPNNNQYPNDTYIGLIRSDGYQHPDWCAAPVATGQFVTLSLNMDNSTSYVLGVGWAPPGRSINFNIQIYYRGDQQLPFAAGFTNSPRGVLTAIIMMVVASIAKYAF